MTVNTTIGLAGRYKLVIYRADGSARQDTGWIDNVITDIGLERMGTASFGGWCRVGSGSSTPKTTDTTLDVQVASSSSTSSAGSGAQTSPPYFGWARRTFRFAGGIAAGTLSEVGIGWAATGESLFSRALILDADGNPTTITVLSDETLDVTYELRTYMNTEDVPFEIDISGQTHSGVLRPAEVTASAGWANTNFAAVSSSNNSSSAYSGTIGPITTTPSGTSYGGTQADSPYVPNSRRRVSTMSWGLEGGNAPGGIRSAILRCSTACGAGRWQMSFDPPILKDNTMTLSLVAALKWGRYEG